MKSWSQKFKNGRYVENKATIAEHLGRIDQNARATHEFGTKSQAFLR